MVGTDAILPPKGLPRLTVWQPAIALDAPSGSLGLLEQQSAWLSEVRCRSAGLQPLESQRHRVLSSGRFFGDG